MDDGSDATGCLVDIATLGAAARVLRTTVIAALFLAALLDGSPATAQNAYIPNYNSNTVSVIATATNTVGNVSGGRTPAICVGNGPDGVAVTPDGSKVYVANSNSNTVSVI